MFNKFIRIRICSSIISKLGRKDGITAPDHLKAVGFYCDFLLYLISRKQHCFIFLEALSFHLLEIIC